MRLAQLSLLSLALSLTCAIGCGGQDAGRIDEACRSNADCEATEFCATNICNDGLGACTPRPESCDEVPVALVCGCDGRTYDNVCLAQQAGQRLANEGACFCADNSECFDDQFCELTDSCSNRGTCLPRPPMCEPDPEDVCGCDGVDYGNACLAAQSGARVSALGPCECTTNDDCESDEYCDAITCDGPGGCSPRPTTCPDEGPEVTGCDGVVYPSACDAALAGVRVRP
ncbi:MAG: hypothetical protein AAF436_14620 [Myxococcota bacterium]